jgi:cellulose biosynthesis protein BcsQ
MFHLLELPLMESIDLVQFLERYIQSNPLATLAAGVTLGAFFCFLAMQAIRAVRRTRPLNPTVSKGGIVPSSRVKQDPKPERARNQREAGQPDLENQRVCEKVLQQEGQITALKDQIVELSSVCERVTSENLDIRGELRREKKVRRQVQNAAKQYSEQLDRIAQSDGKLWLNAPDGRSVPFLPMTMRRTAIISTANLKGGVGKTTITANLGATLARLGLRVLLVDLDYQSSLSTLCLSSPESDQVRRSGRYVNGLLENGGDLSRLNQCVTLLQADVGDGQLYLAPVSEGFADIENRLMTRWYSGLADDDVRYRLRHALHSRDLRDHYDVVLIDCPPRLTTGCVNALAASDYVLIPVLLEETSTEAVPRTLSWLKRFQDRVCAELDVLGVVGNKANPRAKLISRQQILWTGLELKCRNAWGKGVRLFDEIIRDHADVSGRFAALDPKYECRYHALVDQIREEIPNACLEPATVSALATAPSQSGRN